MVLDPLERLMRHVEKTSRGCLMWKGGTDARGYGHFFILENGKRKIVYPCQWLYERTIGIVPPGEVLRHSCGQPSCINPAHRILVSRSQLAYMIDTPPSANSRKTHCKRGHRFNEQNTYFHNGHRNCRVCARLRSRERGFSEIRPGSKKN